MNSFQRSGKWTKEEELYAIEIIRAFHSGTLDLHQDNEISLRRYLAKKLFCSPKRISKKYESSGYNGKIVYVSNPTVTAEQKQITMHKLRMLESRFLSSIESLKAEEASKRVDASFPASRLSDAAAAPPASPSHGAATSDRAISASANADALHLAGLQSPPGPLDNTRNAPVDSPSQHQPPLNSASLQLGVTNSWLQPGFTGSSSPLVGSGFATATHAALLRGDIIQERRLRQQQQQQQQPNQLVSERSNATALYGSLISSDAARHQTNTVNPNTPLRGSLFLDSMATSALTTTGGVLPFSAHRPGTTRAMRPAPAAPNLPANLAAARAVQPSRRHRNISPGSLAMHSLWQQQRSAAAAAVAAAPLAAATVRNPAAGMAATGFGSGRPLPASLPLLGTTSLDETRLQMLQESLRIRNATRFQGLLDGSTMVPAAGQQVLGGAPVADELVQQHGHRSFLSSTTDDDTTTSSSQYLGGQLPFPFSGVAGRKRSHESSTSSSDDQNEGGLVVKRGRLK